MKYLIPAFLVLMTAVVGCSKDEVDPNSPYYSVDSVAVAANSCTTKKYNGDTTIVYCLDSVNDSRCPINALCIWQGYAAAKMSLTINQVTHKVQLNTPVNYPSVPNDTTIAGFRFRLLDVTPYPSLPQNNANKTAIIKVSRL